MFSLVMLIALLLGGSMIIYTCYILVSTWHFSKISFPGNFFYTPQVSIVVPARNEAGIIRTCLLSLLAQNYPENQYEIILVDDQSTDDTVAIARAIQENFSQLKVIHSNPPPETRAYKKAAITRGVQQAKGEIIVQMDADCWVEPDWLRSLLNYFEDHVGMVCGPVALVSGQNRWFEKLQVLESMGLVALGAAAIAAGRGNMCNGANMAYRKSLFEAVGGFDQIDHFASGDDELLLQKFRQLKDWKVVFAKKYQAMVFTYCLPNWRDLKAQRIRWVSKARYYRDRSINIIQSISYLGFLSFPVLGIVGFIHPTYWIILLALFVLKFSADLVLMLRAASFFRRKDLLMYLPGLQLLYVPYVLWIGIAGNLVRQYQWKDRMVQ